jgi:hypothetical protein
MILAYIDYYNLYKAHPYAWTYTGQPLVTGNGKHEGTPK